MTADDDIKELFSTVAGAEVQTPDCFGFGHRDAPAHAQNAISQDLAGVESAESYVDDVHVRTGPPEE